MYYLDIAEAFELAEQLGWDVNDLKGSIKGIMHQLGDAIQTKLPGLQFITSEIQAPAFAGAALGFKLNVAGKRSDRLKAEGHLVQYDPSGGDA